MPLPKAVAGSLDKYADTDVSAGTGIISVIHGRPKVGKTSLAATYSEFYKPDAPCFLDDICFGVMDNDGIAALETRRLKDKDIPVTAHTINFLELWGEHGFQRGNRLAAEQLKAWFEARPQIRCFVVDSLTSLDVEANAKHYDGAPTDQDHWTSFRLILGEHRIFHSAVRKLGIDVIYNCHSRVLFEDDKETEKVKQKKEALRMVGGGFIVPSLTGQALTVYQRDISLQGAITLKTDGKGNERRVLTLIENTGKGIEVGSRYAHLFDSKDELYNLRAVYERIRAARQSAKSAQGESK